MYSRFLVPLDGSPTSLLAIDYAADLARLSGATVILLHVIEPTRHSTGFERAVGSMAKRPNSHSLLPWARNRAASAP